MYEHHSFSNYVLFSLLRDAGLCDGHECLGILFVVLVGRMILSLDFAFLLKN